MSLQIELYRAGATKNFKRFEDLNDNEKISVYPLPLTPNTFNICMEVDWNTKDGTSSGSGFKYLLITQDNLHNLATNIVTGYDAERGKVTVVRIIGDIFWAVKQMFSDQEISMIPQITKPGDGALTQILLDELVLNTVTPGRHTTINLH